MAPLATAWQESVLISPPSVKHLLDFVIVFCASPPFASGSTHVSVPQSVGSIWFLFILLFRHVFYERGVCFSCDSSRGFGSSLPYLLTLFFGASFPCPRFQGVTSCLCEFFLPVFYPVFTDTFFSCVTTVFYSRVVRHVFAPSGARTLVSPSLGFTLGFRGRLARSVSVSVYAVSPGALPCVWAVSRFSLHIFFISGR